MPSSSVSEKRQIKSVPHGWQFSVINILLHQLKRYVMKRKLYAQGCLILRDIISEKQKAMKTNRATNFKTYY